MYLASLLFSLPSSILLVLLTPAAATNTSLDSSLHTVQDSQWPYNLAPHLKYWPDDPPHQRRDLDFIQKRMANGELPDVVKKMSPDEGEMFFHDYWSFNTEGVQASLGRRLDGFGTEKMGRDYKDDDNALLHNTSAALRFRPALKLHLQESIVNSNLELNRRGQRFSDSTFSIGDMFKRAACPAGTNVCATNGYCCPTSDTCITITDTGLGPVGCCPTGSTCAGEITTCAAGETACPQSLGGACCIAGFQCAGVGCVQSVVMTITSVLTISATPMTSVITSTIISSASTDTSLQTTSACASGASACPINLGGGCCGSGRVCTTGLICPLSVTTSITTIVTTNTLTSTATSHSSTSASTTNTPSAPVRPTTSEDETTTASSTTILVPGTCPTGFYQCSAYYNAGACCRVGRNCQTTDCPSSASTTLISDGITIAVPLTASATTFATGTCAIGWSTCGGSGVTAGGCCPSGYGCGSQSCTSAAASTTGIVGKEGTSSGADRVRERRSIAWICEVSAMVATLVLIC